MALLGCGEPEEKVASGDGAAVISHSSDGLNSPSDDHRVDRIDIARVKLSNTAISKKERFQTLLKLCNSSPSIESLEESWEIIERHGKIDNRDQFFKNHLLMSLAVTEDPEELLDFVLERTGPGKDRNQMISSVFSGTVLPIERIVGYLSGLEFQSEKEAVALGIARLGRVDGSENFLPLLSSYLTSGHEVLEKGALSALSSIAWAGDYETTVPLVLGVLDDKSPELRKSALNSFVKNSPHSAPLFMFEQIQSQFGQEGFGSLERSLRVGLVKQMSMENPLDSVENVLSLGVQFPAELSVSFKSWFNRDVQAAIGWYSDRAPRLDDIQNDVIVGEIIDGAIEKGEIGTAKEWTKSIRSQEVVQRVLEEIDSLENSESGDEN